MAEEAGGPKGWELGPKKELQTVNTCAAFPMDQASVFWKSPSESSLEGS